MYFLIWKIFKHFLFPLCYSEIHCATVFFRGGGGCWLFHRIVFLQSMNVGSDFYIGRDGSFSGKVLNFVQAQI